MAKVRLTAKKKAQVIEDLGLDIPYTEMKALPNGTVQVVTRAGTFTWSPPRPKKKLSPVKTTTEPQTN